MVGRTVAVMLIAMAYLLSYYFPINVGIAAITAMIALGGLTSLAAAGTRYERHARYAVFAFDATAVTVLLAFIPLSSGGDVPQNMVFLTSSVQHYYVVIAAAVLTLSPPLVLWTGAWAAGGLLFATGWILSGMDKVVSYSSLPISPSREIYIQTVLDPNFLGIASRLQEALIITLVTAIAALAVHRARRVVSDHAKAEAGRRRVQSLFGRYVPAPILRELLDEGHLAPQARHATLLFADIAGFTRLSEGLHPTRLVHLLNEFFSAVTEIVDQHGGVVINYLGDALLISFNAPLPVEHHADAAVHASQDILAMIQQREFDGIQIRLRIGIATGLIAAGTVGTGDRQTYTLYGDAVNLAQRLQELNKETGTSCLISGITAQQINANIPLTRVGTVPIRNVRMPIEIFRHSDI
ncbi:adenylate/guanylate cyclase domain-containing protein [Rhizobium sp. S153]|uniref:Adenylate/guanylate cyclase domain-containing protein n=1 Tax=Ciceribacter sichuanensis TaxID=2949647 RepID=A0ABT0VFH9_9HYPH|nr:adenylate/guanylate cyclase domain-containing protein [Ciceribacter sp. S153]MCM2404227.1 adenylate/guanylate cyclase domain-containing protein [Ciceribacter sp. S153]